MERSVGGNVPIVFETTDLNLAPMADLCLDARVVSNLGAGGAQISFFICCLEPPLLPVGE